MDVFIHIKHDEYTVGDEWHQRHLIDSVAFIQIDQHDEQTADQVGEYQDIKEKVQWCDQGEHTEQFYIAVSDTAVKQVIKQMQDQYCRKIAQRFHILKVGQIQSSK